MIDVRALAYVVVEAQDIGRWQSYGEQVMGTMSTPAPDHGLYLKLDDRPFRYLVLKGQSDRYVASGWEVADSREFDKALKLIEAAGVAVRHGTKAEVDARRFQQMAWFLDPSGNRHEIVWGVRSDFASFDSPVNVPHFVTGELGMGHTVLAAPKFDETWKFFRDVMGFGLSDIYNHRAGPDAPAQRLFFTHCNNGREHSLALFECDAPPSGCIHVMAEVGNVTEVGRALDRCTQKGFKLMASLGQHVNDDVISFYMLTPGGFSMEFGCGGVVVDWSKHTVFEATTISRWGHDWSLGLATGHVEEGA